MLIGAAFYLAAFTGAAICSHENIMAVYISYGAFCGTGFGALVLGNLFSLLVPLLGIKTVFLLIGVCCSAGIAFCVCKIHSSSLQDIKTLKVHLAIAPNASWHNNLAPFRSIVFYIFVFWISIVLPYGISVIGNTAVNAQSLGASVQGASLLAGLVSFTQGLSRVVLGLVYNKYGLIAAMLIMSLSAVLSSVLAFIAFGFPCYLALL